MTPAFVGFVVVALVGAAAEMTSAFSAARKNRLDLSVGIALGAPPDRAIRGTGHGPSELLHRTGPLDLRFWPGAVFMVFIATLSASSSPTAVDRRGSWARADGLSGFRDDPLPAAAARVIRRQSDSPSSLHRRRHSARRLRIPFAACDAAAGRCMQPARLSTSNCAGKRPRPGLG